MLKSASKRNQNLDALRAIAVLMVLLRHRSPIPGPARLGWAGVDLFFVLSGWLISGLLFEEWIKRGRLDLKRFYIRRGLKIYPAFYAMILVGLLYSWAIGRKIATGRILAELAFVQNYWHGIWNHTWSLAVEEHFYFALPLTLYLMQRFDRSADPFRHFRTVFLVVATLALTFRIAAGFSGATQAQYLYPTHLRLDALAFGVLLRYYRIFRPDRFRRVSTWQVGVTAGLFVTALLAALPVDNLAMHTVGLTLVYLGFGLVLAWAVDAEAPQFIVPAVTWLARMGFYSYSIYLWHMFVLVRFEEWIGQGPMQAVLYVFTSIIAGIAFAKLVEVPVLAWRDHRFKAEGEKSTISNIEQNPPESQATSTRGTAVIASGASAGEGDITGTPR